MACSICCGVRGGSTRDRRDDVGDGAVLGAAGRPASRPAPWSAARAPASRTAACSRTRTAGSRSADGLADDGDERGRSSSAARARLGRARRASAARCAAARSCPATVTATGVCGSAPAASRPAAAASTSSARVEHDERCRPSAAYRDQSTPAPRGWTTWNAAALGGGQRDAGVGGDGGRRGHAGDDLERHVGLAAGERPPRPGR